VKRQATIGVALFASVPLTVALAATAILAATDRVAWSIVYDLAIATACYALLMYVRLRRRLRG
jgi:uncharacterized membrane protein